MTFAEDFEKSLFANVQNGRLARQRSALVFRKKRNQLVQVYDRTVKFVSLQVVSSHANFTKITRMVLVEVDSVVVLTTGVTATARMLAVLSDATMTVTYVASQFSRLLGLFFRHFTLYKKITDFKQIETTQL